MSPNNSNNKVGSHEEIIGNIFHQMENQEI